MGGGSSGKHYLQMSSIFSLYTSLIEVKQMATTPKNWSNNLILGDKSKLYKSVCQFEKGIMNISNTYFCFCEQHELGLTQHIKPNMVIWA